MPKLIRVARTFLAQGRPPSGAPPDRLEPREVAALGAAVQKLSHGLTRERALVGERYMDQPQLLAAYLLFYWPVSYAQMRRLLGELPAPLGPALDLGSGPAPASFAALDAGASRVLAADRSASALKLASQLAAGSKSFNTQRWTPDGPLPDGQFALIMAQHLLNELWEGASAIAQRAVLCRKLLGKLSPGGTLLLVEPALRDTSRPLLELRDILVREGFAVRAPCLYRGDCQALHRPSDWCHAERDWEATPVVLELARAAGLHKESLKMSYLALAPAGEQWVVPPPGRVLRVVSEQLQGKGRLRYMGCGPDGRMGLALQHKHLSDANRHFEQLERGEIIRVEGAAPKGDGLGLGEGSRVELLAAPGEPLPPRPVDA